MRKRIARAMLLLTALLACGCASRGEETMKAEFFDVGKADAALLTLPGGRRVMIDAGTNKEGKHLAERLTEGGVTALDALIVTHFDKDHVGGADKLLESLDVAQVVMPDYAKDGKQYEQFMEALESSPATRVTRMGTGETLSLDLGGEATLTLTSAHETDYGRDEENDFSLALRVVYGGTRFLFTGDAEDARQRELLAEGDVACDVLKVPHHGRLHEASAAFVQAAAPKIAFVSDSDEEPADAALLALLRETGCAVYSARDGDLTVFSDGERVWAEQ